MSQEQFSPNQNTENFQHSITSPFVLSPDQKKRLDDIRINELHRELTAEYARLLTFRAVNTPGQEGELLLLRAAEFYENHGNVLVTETERISEGEKEMYDPTPRVRGIFQLDVAAAQSFKKGVRKSDGLGVKYLPELIAETEETVKSLQGALKGTNIELFKDMRKVFHPLPAD